MRVAAAAVLVLACAATVSAAEDALEFTPAAGPPGTLIHATGLAAVCGEVVESLDFVKLYRAEGVYTGDDLVFPPGAEVTHSLEPIHWIGPDGEFHVPDAPPGRYFVYLQCYERELLQTAPGALLTVTPAGTPPTDTAGGAPRPSGQLIPAALLAGLMLVALVLIRAPGPATRGGPPQG